MDIWGPQDWITFWTYLALPISLSWSETGLAPALHCSWRCWKPALPAVPRCTAPLEGAYPVPMGVPTGNRTLNQLRQASCLSPSPTQIPSLPLCVTNLTRQLFFFLQVKAKQDQDLLHTACFNTGHLGPVIQGDSEAIPSPLELAGRVPPASSEQHHMSQGRSQQEFCHHTGL